MVTRPSTRSLMIAAAVLVAVIASVVVAVRFMGDEEPQQGPRRPGPADIPSVAQPVPCDLMAAPDGDDGADGSTDRPFRTAQQLMQSLQPGQTGCLAAGEYTGGLQLASGGSDGRPITLAAADPTEERPRLLGRIVIEDSANDVVISGLNLNGRNDDKLPSPTINGDNVVLRGNDISNDNFGICVNLGHPSFGTAVGTVIQDNRIHNCGEYPVTNLEHGIYVGTARDTTIEGNLIYDNADRGIQLYPDAQRTRITHNVIDGNGTGVIFSGSDGTVPSDNYVADNIISNSQRYNIDAFWGDDEVGTDNVVENNCLWGAGIAEISEEPGFTAQSNIVVDPEFVDRDSAQFRVQAGSPCSGRTPGWMAS
jgi:parallel beta-helix repeat protein